MARFAEWIWFYFTAFIVLITIINAYSSGKNKHFAGLQEKEITEIKQSDTIAQPGKHQNNVEATNRETNVMKHRISTTNHLWDFDSIKEELVEYLLRKDTMNKKEYFSMTLDSSICEVCDLQLNWTAVLQKDITLPSEVERVLCEAAFNMPCSNILFAIFGELLISFKKLP